MFFCVGHAAVSTAEAFPCLRSVLPSRTTSSLWNSDGLDPAAYVFSERNTLASSLLDDLGRGLSRTFAVCSEVQVRIIAHFSVFLSIFSHVVLPDVTEDVEKQCARSLEVLEGFRGSQELIC